MIILSTQPCGSDPFFADSPDMLPLAKEKISTPLFATVVRTLGQASTADRSIAISEQIAQSLFSFHRSGSNTLIPLTGNLSCDADDIFLRRSRRLGMLLNSNELTSLVHIPDRSIMSPRLRTYTGKTKRAPSDLEQHSFELGINSHLGQELTVTLSCISSNESGLNAFQTFFHGGGEVTITNSTIQDCNTGIRLHRYGWGSVSGAGPSGPGYPVGYEDEQSSFSQTLFKGCNVAIFTEYNIGLSISGNTFVQNGTDYEGYLSAVTATGNAFTSFAYIASEHPLIVGSSFTSNSFTNSIFGVDAQGNFTRHNFRRNIATSGSQLALFGELWYEVNDNVFTNSGIGCFIESTGDNLQNRVMNNEFNSNGIANAVFGENDMEFLANCFNGTINADIEINNGASIHEMQGTEVASAGNCYTDGARIMTGTGIGSFTYWTKDGFETQCNYVNNCKYPGDCNGFDIKRSQLEIQVDCESNMVNDPPSELNCQCGGGANGCTDAIASIRDIIANLENGANQQKEMLIAQYLRCLDQLMRTYVDTALAQGNVESCITYLAEQPEFRYRIMAYGIMNHNLEYDRARGYLDTLGTSKTEEAEFVAVQHIYLDYAADINSYTLLPPDSIALLNAGERYNPLAGYARTLFYKLTGIRITRAFTHLDQSVTLRSPYGWDKSEVTVPVGSIQVFPNPTNRSTVEISIPDFQTERQYEVSVFSIYGNLISTSAVTSNRHTAAIGETSGVYIVLLRIDGIPGESVRVVRI